MLAAMVSPPDLAPRPWPKSQLDRLQQRWIHLSDHDQVGVCLAAMGSALVGWALVWQIPTEVSGQGVFLFSNNAAILNARAGGQVIKINAKVGDQVKKGQVLMTLYLPVLARQLQQEKGNLAQLQRINSDLDHRDRMQLQAEATTRDTALAKLADDRKRYQGLQTVYASKLRNLDWLSQRQVVAPLSNDVVGAQQALTSTSVNLDDVKINAKKVVANYQQVKVTLETAAQQRRYQIDDLKRQIKVTEAKIAYEGLIEADRDGTVLDLQVTPGQTVGTGQRLGTIGRPDQPSGNKLPLEVVAYFSPADARRLPLGLPVEVVPLWNQRGRFGGITGKVKRVLTLPATADDISTTIGNPQLAQELSKNGPVMRVDISLDRDPASVDGYRWTLSGGSSVFRIRDGLTAVGHAYVEWRTPISYVLPGLRSLTGGYRSQRIDRKWDKPFLRQQDRLP